MSVFEVYGLIPMSAEDEFDLPETLRKTRRNKKGIYNDCEYIRRVAEDYMGKARRIPELDDEKHAETVQRLADAIHALCEEFVTTYDKISTSC